MASPKQNSVLYIILAIALLIFGLIKKQTSFIYAAIIIALVSFYWIFKALKFVYVKRTK